MTVVPPCRPFLLSFSAHLQGAPGRRRGPRTAACGDDDDECIAENADDDDDDVDGDQSGANAEYMQNVELASGPVRLRPVGKDLLVQPLQLVVRQLRQSTAIVVVRHADPEQTGAKPIKCHCIR